MALLLYLTPPGWALEHTGVWSSMVMCQMGTAKDSWQKGVMSSRVELERRGSSNPIEPLWGIVINLLYFTESNCFLLFERKSSGCLGSCFQAVRYQLPTLQQCRFSFPDCKMSFGLPPAGFGPRGVVGGAATKMQCCPCHHHW